MGLYIQTEDKSGFFNEHGGEVTLNEALEIGILKDDKLLCCLIDNGAFYAFAVIYSEDELPYIAITPEDPRPKRYCYIDIDTLKTVCPEWDTYLEDDV